MMFSRQIPNSEFTSRPWRIHEILDDGYILEDVWARPLPGGPDDLAIHVWNTTKPERPMSDFNPVVRFLFDVRWRLGGLLGWDSERQQVGKRVASLRDNLPEDLRAVRGPDMHITPFKSVYLTHDEWTAEFSGAMGHIVMHHGWVRDETGTYYPQMAALVKPHGLFGKVYMYGIAPLRRFVVYPLMFRTESRQWPSVRQEWARRQPDTQ